MRSYDEARSITEKTLSEWNTKPPVKVSQQELMMIKAWVASWIEDKEFLSEEDIDELIIRMVAIYNLGLSKNKSN